MEGHKESIFFHYILDNNNILNVTKPEFFMNSNLRELFEIAKEHALKYKSPPKREQLEELVSIRGLSEKYGSDMLEALYNSRKQLESYEKEWLEENVGAWIQFRNLDHTMRKAIAYIKTNKVSAENTSEIVEKVRHMISSETSIDFTFNLGADFFDPRRHLQTRLARTSSGYDYLDLCLKGGYWKGSLVVLICQPKGGKSLVLQNLCAQSVLLGQNCAYVTLELQEELVNMRIGSNLLSIPLNEYEERARDQDFMKKKISKLKQSQLTPMGNLHVKEFPASTASVNDVKFYLKKAEEMLGYKFDNIFIDYINIMKNWRNPNTENTYMKIKQLSEDLRAMAMEEQWAIISVTQTKRDGWNNTDINVNDISESAGLLHTVDVMFGIITDPEMKARGEYVLKCLANRVAGYENTRKKFNIDWKYFRLEEDKDSPIEDLDEIINSLHNRTYHRSETNGNKTNNREITVIDNDEDPLGIGDVKSLFETNR
jgi:hypothetical protein